MLALTPDGKTAVFSDEVLTVRAIDTESGSLLWENAAESERKSSDYSPAEVFAYQNLIICKYADLIIPQGGENLKGIGILCKYIEGLVPVEDRL